MKEHLSLFLAFWGLGLLTFAAEHLFPARQVKYRLVLLSDIVALAVYSVCFAIIVPFTDRISIPDYVPAGVLKVGTLYKLLLFYIVEDLGLYWGSSFDAHATVLADPQVAPLSDAHVLACRGSGFDPAHHLVQLHFCRS